MSEKVPESEWPAGTAPDGVPADQPSPADADLDVDTAPEPEPIKGSAPAPARDGTAGPDAGRAADAGGTGPNRDADLEHQRNELGRTLRTMQEDLQAARDENRRFREVLAAAAGIPPDGATAPADPKRLELAQKIVGLLNTAYPGFDKVFKLAERADDVFGAADFAKDARSIQETQWQRSAVETVEYFDAQFAKRVLGDGADPKAVPPEQLGESRADFVAWVQRDPGRVARYEGGDTRKLVDEFVARAYGLYAAPTRRREVADLRARQDRAKHLPVGGSSAAPVSTGPKKPDLEDEDAVHERSWDALQGRLKEQGA